MKVDQGKIADLIIDEGITCVKLFSGSTLCGAFPVDKEQDEPEEIKTYVETYFSTYPGQVTKVVGKRKSTHPKHKAMHWSINGAVVPYANMNIGVQAGSIAEITKQIEARLELKLKTKELENKIEFYQEKHKPYNLIIEGIASAVKPIVTKKAPVMNSPGEETTDEENDKNVDVDKIVGNLNIGENVKSDKSENVELTDEQTRAKIRYIMDNFVAANVSLELLTKISEKIKEDPELIPMLRKFLKI